MKKQTVKPKKEAKAKRKKLEGAFAYDRDMMNYYMSRGPPAWATNNNNARMPEYMKSLDIQSKKLKKAKKVLNENYKNS